MKTYPSVPVLLFLMLCVGQVSAETSRWLQFPMYPNDTAHAVDREALKMRPDGLLQSGARYPRTDKTSWTAEQNELAWYEYMERLIDCSTGMFLDTRYMLLDKQNKIVAEKSISPDQWIERIALRQSEVTDYKWPQMSEIAIACLAASDKSDKGNKISAATLDNPLDYFLPGYGARRPGEPYPPSGLEKIPATADDFLQMQRKDYMLRYESMMPKLKKRTVGPLKPDKTADNNRAKLSFSNGYSSYPVEIEIITNSLRTDGNGMLDIQIVADTNVYDTEWPRFLAGSVSRLERLRIDCRSGLHAAVDWTYLDDQKPVYQQTLSPIQSINNQYQNINQAVNTTWSPLKGPGMSGVTAVGATCIYAASRCNGEAYPGKLPEFEIDPSKLPTTKDAAVLLLAARSIWEQHQARFIPTCRIGE
jgi:hypothetical protein